jgi:hypothetical protein
LASYVGLIPAERSRGRRQRLGRITIQGNPLLRFLWTEAGGAPRSGVETLLSPQTGAEGLREGMRVDEFRPNSSQRPPNRPYAKSFHTRPKWEFLDDITMTLATSKLRLVLLGRLWLFAFLFSFLLQGHDFRSDLVNESGIRSTTHRINCVTSPGHTGVSDYAHIQSATFALLLVGICTNMDKDSQVALHGCISFNLHGMGRLVVNRACSMSMHDVLGILPALHDVAFNKLIGGLRGAGHCEQQE